MNLSSQIHNYLVAQIFDQALLGLDKAIPIKP